MLALSRSSLPAIDYGDETSLKMAADWVAGQCALQQVELRLLVVASGFLHGPQGQPERSFRQLDAGYLKHVFQVNTIGPALGGWYGYRASKAALNQLVKTASIEMTRRNRQSVCVALHPGTIDTALSQPFAKTGLAERPAPQAAADLLAVLAALTPADTGALVDYRGQPLPW